MYAQQQHGDYIGVGGIGGGAVLSSIAQHNARYGGVPSNAGMDALAAALAEQQHQQPQRRAPGMSEAGSVAGAEFGVQHYGDDGTREGSGPYSGAVLDGIQGESSVGDGGNRWGGI